MLWNQWFMNVQDYSCPTIVLLKEKVLLLFGLQVNDGIFKKWPPTHKTGSRDAIASKNWCHGDRDIMLWSLDWTIPIDIKIELDTYLDIIKNSILYDRKHEEIWWAVNVYLNLKFTSTIQQVLLYTLNRFNI